MHKSLSKDSRCIPWATLKGRGSCVISIYLWWLVPFNTNKHWPTDNEMQLISACSCLLGTDAQVFSHEMSKLEPIHPSASKDTSFFFIYGKVSAYCMNCTPGIYPIIGEHSTHVLICVSLYLSFLVQGVIGLETNRLGTQFQCSGSVTFWYGSGCGSVCLDSYFWLTEIEVKEKSQALQRKHTSL